MAGGVWAEMPRRGRGLLAMRVLAPGLVNSAAPAFTAPHQGRHSRASEAGTPPGTPRLGEARGGTHRWPLETPREALEGQVSWATLPSMPTHSSPSLGSPPGWGWVCAPEGPRGQLAFCLQWQPEPGLGNGSPRARPQSASADPQDPPVMGRHPRGAAWPPGRGRAGSGSKSSLRPCHSLPRGLVEKSPL